MDPGSVSNAPGRWCPAPWALITGAWFSATEMRGFRPAFLLLVLASLTAQVGATTSGTPDASRQAEIVRLVRNDCGSCHGLTLQGGLGPPLLPATLADKPDVALRETILRGRNGTAMPPWARFLSESDAQWVVEQLKNGFPNAH